MNYVNEKISHVMRLLDADGGGTVAKSEFCKILEHDEARMASTTSSKSLFYMSQKRWTKVIKA